MNFFKINFALLIVLSSNFLSAQTDLLDELDSSTIKEKEIEIAAFKGLQVCTMQSTKLAAKGEWYFLVTHKFGDLTDGFDNFFGLDNAITKIGGLYGFTDWLTVGISRHTYNKIYESTVKYKLANQEINGFPITIVGYNTMEINSQLSKGEYPSLELNNRASFSTQLLVSRKFSENISLQLNGIYVHKNLYDAIDERDKNFLVALGGRCKVSNRISINGEYAARLNSPISSLYKNSATIGMDLDTGGHIFQMIFSNSQFNNDINYLTNASGIKKGKGIYFGFNLYRVF